MRREGCLRFLVFSVVLLAGAGAARPAQAADGKAEPCVGCLRAGAASATLSLPEGTPLAGYGTLARRLAIPDLNATTMTLTLTALAADSFLGGGDNSRALRRISAVAAMIAGAIIGAALVLHSGLVLPLAASAASTILITIAYALHPTSRSDANNAR